MTREALEKLNEKQKNYCETLSVLIARDRDKGDKEQCRHNSGKLRGFLECLTQLEILTGSELKALYLWYFTEDRGTKKNKS